MLRAFIDATALVVRIASVRNNNRATGVHIGNRHQDSFQGLKISRYSHFRIFGGEREKGSNRIVMKFCIWVGVPT